MRAPMMAIGFAVVIAVAGASCAVEEANEAVAETHQEVSGSGWWSWGCDNTNCATPLFPQDGWVCFLAGVWGNLQGSNSQVQVLTSGGDWGLQVSSHHPLGGNAVCVPGTVAATGTWHSGGPAAILGSARIRTNRRCFLSGVINNGGFTSANHVVQIHTVGNNVVLDGDTGGDTTAFAVCVDVPTVTSSAPFSVGDGVGSTVNIVDNTEGGWVCGLRAFGGHFNTNDYNDGVWVDYSSPFWRLNGVNGKTAVAGCVK
jgi:hypothetical protein